MEPQAPIAPTSFRACARCHGRKVKCDGTIPQCGACRRSDQECNITECVTYSYNTVHRLQVQVERLHQQLAQLGSSPSRSRVHSEPLEAEHRHDVETQLLQTGIPGTERGVDDFVAAVAEEVGNLTLGAPDGPSQRYVGSAAGSTFARIFLGSLRVGPTDIPFQDVRPSVTMLQKSVEPTATQACLPSKATAKTLLAIYISRIHTWWPFLHLPTLRHWFSTIYDAPQACDSFQKFAVFVILAIASVEAENAPEVPHLRNLFSPEDYLATALRFYDMIPKDPELRSLQSVLLLTLWMMRSGNTADSLNLWQISRFAMSIAIELGYHRNSPNWEFGVLDLELRNRAWWCTYGLERMIAVSTGRTLSLRNQAIDAAFPQAIHDDLLRPDEASVAQFFHNKGIVPATLMFQLYAIGGDILESVYIARPRLSMTAGTMQNLVNSLRKRLMSWRAEAEHIASVDDPEFLEMRIWFALATLTCNRPSPSFSEPSPDAIESCAEASKLALMDWTKLMEMSRISHLWRTFHDVLMVGLVWTYCAW
ncbi:uncharacterized protein LTHEOB_2532 [Neofusicoccum parvum]|uniref:Uncharacterized protein LTHEOB_2532 n=1 Tax=Neofusicoccum parvum TaxID=310453 RepID=A0ACB5S750_9PEZI|nr:uncharacterized protein LTHEOB_2532 [Neofusicoccum parvum]